MADKKAAATKPQTWDKRKRAPDMYAPKKRAEPDPTQKEPSGQYGAISKNPKTGKYIRTRHHTRAKAQRRLDGNRWHIEKRLVDFGDLPAGFMPVTVTTPSKPKSKEA